MTFLTAIDRRYRVVALSRPVGRRADAHGSTAWGSSRAEDPEKSHFSEPPPLTPSPLATITSQMSLSLWQRPPTLYYSEDCRYAAHVAKVSPGSDLYTLNRHREQWNWNCCRNGGLKREQICYAIYVELCETVKTRFDWDPVSNKLMSG